MLGQLVMAARGHQGHVHDHRHRPPHPRRHRHPRLHPRVGPRAGARARGREVRRRAGRGRRAQHGHQRRHRVRRDRARAGGVVRAGLRPGGAGHRGAAAPRRRRRCLRQRRPLRRAAGLEDRRSPSTTPSRPRSPGARSDRRSWATSDCSAAGAGPGVAAPGGQRRQRPGPGRRSRRARRLRRGPLAGRTIVHRPRATSSATTTSRARCARLVPAGGFRKPCNTTGTATRGGYPEATFVWQVSRLLADAPARAGRRRCVMTRHSNRQDRWGPCVDVRGRAGNRVGADLKVSVHGDGSTAAGPAGST